MKTEHSNTSPISKLFVIVFISVFLFLTMNTLSLAQETLGFGVAAGRTGGSGFSVRKLPMDGFGWQAGGIYLRSADMTYFNLGAEEFYILNHTQNTCLYLAGGLSYSYERTKEENWVWDAPRSAYITEVTRNTSKGFAVGAGVGVAFRYAQWDQIWFSADLLLTAYHDTVLPSPQCAVHYFFR